MKVRKALFLFMIFIMILTISGCKNNIKTVQTSEKKDYIKEQPIHKPVMAQKKKEENKKSTLITDPVELQKLWNDYLYNTITTIGYKGDFKSTQEIDPVDVAQYCYNQYFDQHDKDSLEYKYDSIPLFPRSKILEYAKRYLNLTHIDWSKIPDGLYDSQKHVFLAGMKDKEPNPSYTDKNSFCTHISKAIKNSDDTITVALKSYDTYKTRRVKYIQTYTLKERKDGSLYFLNSKKEYINNHLVSFKGDYKHFDKILGFEGNIEDVFMVGQTNAQIILGYRLYDHRKKLLMLVDPNTLSVEKQIELDKNIECFDVKFSGDRLILLLKNKILVLDNNLKPLENVPLSKALEEKMNVHSHFFDVHGYDVSHDLTKIIYTDGRSIKLFNRIDQKETLLFTIENVLHQTQTEIDVDEYEFSSVKFNTKDQKIMVEILNYGNRSKYILFDLEKQTPNLPLVNEGLPIRNNNISNGKGTLILQFMDEDEKLFYLDFNSGKLEEMKVTDTIEDTLLSWSYSFAETNFASFVIESYDENDYANSLYFIHPIDLNHLKVEPYIISIQAVSPHIIGVLKDGRILFSYDLNHGEKGICLTK